MGTDNERRDKKRIYALGAAERRRAARMSDTENAVALSGNGSRQSPQQPAASAAG